MKAIIRAVGAAVVLGSVLLALPVALIKMVGYPLPRVVPSWDQISMAFDLGDVASTTIFKALACVLWLVWAWFVVAALSEAIAHLRGLAGARIPRRANPAQQVVARLVTSLAVVVTSLVSRSTVAPAEPGPLPAIELVNQITTTPPPLSPDPIEASAAQGATTRAHSGSPTWTVRHRDSLWRIADRALGDGARWREIYELNRAVIGEDPARITKGTSLVLPADATVSQPSSADAVHVVQLGDTLSAIAAETLGDPSRFTELFDANVGKAQPDGEALRDPNLIRPGWSLDMAASMTAEVQEAGGDGAPSSARPPAVSIPIPGEPGVESDASDGVSFGAEATTVVPAPASTVAPADQPAGTGAPNTTAVPGDPPGSPVEDDKDRFPLGGLVVGLPVLAGAALLVRLKMLRRNQMRHHLPGRLIVNPPMECEPLERHVRALSSDDRVSLLDATLRLLTRSLREAPTLEMPPVWGVQHGEGGVELLLQHPGAVAPPGFVALHEGWSWALDPAWSLEELSSLVETESPALPALVGIGLTAEGAVFLNVEHCGLIGVEGDASRVESFLMGCALDLATPTWVQGLVSVLVDDMAGDLASLEDVELVEDRGATLAQLVAQARSSTRALGTRTVVAARGRSDDVWPLSVMISATLADADAAQTEDLALLANARTGAVAIVAGEVPQATWRLSIGADGQAELAPLGLALDLSALDGEVMTRAAQLLGAAAETEGLAPVLDLTAGAEVRSSSPAPVVDLCGEVEVRVLGPVEVTGWDRPPSRRMTTELVVYLATHPGKAIASDRLRCALWPLKDSSSWGAGADPTLKSVVSRARGGLGDDSTGNRHLPEGTTAGYQLGERVWCDWTSFTAAVHAARARRARRGDGVAARRVVACSRCPLCRCGCGHLFMGMVGVDHLGDRGEGQLCSRPTGGDGPRCQRHQNRHLGGTTGIVGHPEP